MELGSPEWGVLMYELLVAVPFTHPDRRKLAFTILGGEATQPQRNHQFEPVRGHHSPEFSLLK